MSEELGQSLGGGDPRLSRDAFSPPLVVPRPPDRHYVLFGEPFDASLIDPRDREECDKAYVDVRSRVEKCIGDAMAWRDRDPYRRSLPRRAYEVISGKDRAPVPSIM